MSRSVYVSGVGMIKFSKYLDKGIKALTGEALDLVLKDSSLDVGDIQAAWFSNTAWGYMANQHSIRGQVALTVHGIDGIPITNVENACASGSTAMYMGWTAIQAGLFDCVLAIGVEKLYDADKMKSMGAFITGSDIEVTTEMLIRFHEEEQKRMKESGTGEGKPHSAFMDFYSMGARKHMEKYGTTQRQFAVIAAKAHNNSALNPLAQYTFPMTVDEVMADREVSYPLTRAMCAPIGDGAAAVILCSDEFMKKKGLKKRVRIAASVLASGNRYGESTITARCAEQAYAAAGVGPSDIDVVEVHDATAFGELHQVEQLGFCRIGEGGPFVESGATSLTGKTPVNPSGGLIARGHPVGASGLAQIYELSMHLRGEAGKRQVEGAKIAMAENGGGFLGEAEAAMAIHILEKV